jgi:glycosyltransferase involved in cell wall biosynthesis
MPQEYLVAQLGARMHYAIPRMLHEAGMLSHFYTDICAVKGWPSLLQHIPGGMQPAGLKRLLGRIPKDVPVEQITAFTAFGLEYQRRRVASLTSTDTTQAHLWAGKRFCELILESGLHNADAIYTFNSAGLELLTTAREKGLRTVMEQTIAPREVEVRLLQAAHERYPGWEPPLADDSARQAFIGRERAEWEQADLILCGSEFVRESIAACGGPVEKCKVVPYGVDGSFSIAERKPHHGPLRVLTVGGVGLRKGSPTVLEAANALRGRAIFRMVGSLAVQPGAQQSLDATLEITGAVPRSEMQQHFGWADVFLLPSLCEGSATVVYEALAAGLPVICTPNTGSVVRDGFDGYIVPVHDVEAINHALTLFVESPDLLHTMSTNARERATDFTLDRYQQRLLAALAGQSEPSDD